MQVRIVRKDGVEMPQYYSNGAVAFDLVASEDVVVPGNGHALMKTGLVVEIPSGYMLGILPRSSTGKKTGLMTFNALGVIDQDYCGLDDEIGVMWFNTRGDDYAISKGDRLAQAVFLSVGVAEFDDLSQNTWHVDESRGGFGSTG